MVLVRIYEQISHFPCFDKVVTKLKNFVIGGFGLLVLAFAFAVFYSCTSFMVMCCKGIYEKYCKEDADHSIQESTRQTTRRGHLNRGRNRQVIV